MKTTTKLALAFVTFAGLVGGVAIAGGPGPDGPGGPEGFGGPDCFGGPRQGMRLERLDKDSSGDVTFDEFAAGFEARVGDADTNHDGTLTVEEIATSIEKVRAERMAERLIERFDTNGDGQLTATEVESRQKKMFALLDRNDDGKVASDELPHRRFGMFGRHGRW